jgi:hypothetical protein
MDTALHGATAALNGLDLLLWIACIAAATRLMRWAYRRPPLKPAVELVTQRPEPNQRPVQLKLAV